MSSELNVRALAASEYECWDRFVDQSPQGTVYNGSLWLKMLGLPIRIFGCFKGQDLVGSIAVIEDPERPRSTVRGAPLTPFGGILFRNPEKMRRTTREASERKISFALIQELHRHYDNITLPLHYTFGDIRPFYWETYGQPQGYQAVVAYTYVVDLRDIEQTWSNMDGNTRFEVHKAEKRGSVVEASNDFAAFERMHRLTFERQSANHETEGRCLPRVYEALKPSGRCQLYLARNSERVITSGVLATWDAKRAYYMFGASDPQYRNDGSASLTLWKVFQCMAQRFPEIDMVGCNSPKRGGFKAGFGGILQHHFIVSIERKPAKNAGE